MPYGVREVLKQLAEVAGKARRINLESKRHFRSLPETFGSHNKQDLHPRVAFHLERLERFLGANIVVGSFPHLQVYTSPQGIRVVAIPKEHFLEMLEQGRFSLHGNLVRVLVEQGKEVPDEEAWIEAHKRSLDSILRNRDNPFAQRAAHEYLSFLISGAAAHELLEGKARVPKELRIYIDAYKQVLRNYGKEALESLAKYYVQFEEAAKRLGFHPF